MRNLRWVFACALVVSVGMVGTLASADVMMVDKAYKQGLEDLQNNMVADAIKGFEKGLADGQSGANPLPDSNEHIQSLRYAYGYALVLDGRLFDAIPVLDTLVASDPGNDPAQYLLAVALLRSMSNENILRGLAVLKTYAANSTDPNARTIASNGAAQLGYNVSTCEYAAGDPTAALALMNTVVGDWGQTPGRDDAENNHIRFALGVYLKDSGDVDGALFELDYLAVARKAAKYTLANGTTLTQVRADAYYQAALARLAEGGATGGKGALDKLKEVEKLEGTGGPNAAHIAHARALAYNQMGDSEKMMMEMKSLQSANPGYYQSVTK